MKRDFLLIFAVIIIVIACAGVYFYQNITKIVSHDPEVWLPEIEDFEEHDQKEMPEQGVIVFTGSSSISFWITLEEDFKPLRVINRGLDGARIDDIQYHTNNLIARYKPKAVVFYIGENDFYGFWEKPKNPIEVFNGVKHLFETIQSDLPEAHIYYLSIKPSRFGWNEWREMQKANKLIKDFMQRDDRLTFIDVSSAMLDSQGKLKSGIFTWDGLHLNQNGYNIWTSIIKPILLEDFPD